MTQPDAALIERLRQSGIRIDAEGNFVHDGDFVLHEGLRSALFRWLDRLPDGRYVLRLDAQRFAYVDVDDTPLVVRALRFDEAGEVVLSLSDGSDERLDAATLTLGGDGVMRCAVRAGRLEARLSTSAAAALAERITQQAVGPVLALGKRQVPLRPRPEAKR
jgi:hypothetical protein